MNDYVNPFITVPMDKVELDIEGMPDDGVTMGWTGVYEEIPRETTYPIRTEKMYSSRPWGSFEVLNKFSGDFGKVKVKRLTVDPGGVLSKQYHNHRSEHWICLRGAGRYLNGSTKGTIRTGESIYIPAGVEHRLENSGILPLEILEVQMGESVAEEDIVRLEDKYGRLK